MLPLGDDDSGYNTPAVVTILLIAANVLVFILFQGMGTNDQFTYAWATVPYEILTGTDVARTVFINDPLSGDAIGKIALQPTPISVYLTLFTSMFMHGGWEHLFGNMLFLYIFGDNVEHRMGSGKFLLFYLLCGLGADFAQIAATALFGGNQFIPSLGASGAISGVLAGYLVLFPQQRVRVLMFNTLQQVPAFVAIGAWFLFQLVSGLGVLGDSSQVGGVAYAAHIGGFVLGFILVRMFAGADNNQGATAPSSSFERMYYR